MGEIIANFLAHDVVALMDLASLRSARESHADGSRSDLIFQAERVYKPGTFFDILVEHKSRPFTYIWDQLLGYIKELFHKKTAKRPVITIVLYNGEDDWNAPHFLKDKFHLTPEEASALGDLIPNAGFVFLNAKTMFEQVKDDPSVSLKLKVFLYAFAFVRTFTEEENFIKFLQFAQPMFHQEEEESFCKHFLAYYAVEACPDIEYARILVNRYTRINKGEEFMATYAEIKQEGIKAGKQEGIKVGKQKGIEEGVQKVVTALNMCKMGHSFETIQKATGLSRDVLIEAGIIQNPEAE